MVAVFAAYFTSDRSLYSCIFYFFLLTKTVIISVQDLTIYIPITVIYTNIRVLLIIWQYKVLTSRRIVLILIRLKPEFFAISAIPKCFFQEIALLRCNLQVPQRL